MFIDSVSDNMKIIYLYIFITLFYSYNSFELLIEYALIICNYSKKHANTVYPYLHAQVNLFINFNLELETVYLVTMLSS